MIILCWIIVALLVCLIAIGRLLYSASLYLRDMDGALYDANKAEWSRIRVLYGQKLIPPCRCDKHHYKNIAD